MHLPHPHLPASFRDFLKAMGATFVGLLMALALESWHQEHRAHSISMAQLASVKAELRQNREFLVRLEKNLTPIVESQKGIKAYLAASPEEQRKMAKPNVDMAQLNLLFSAWDSAVVLGIQRHLRPEQTQALGALYASMKRIQALEDGNLTLEMGAFRIKWQRSWSTLLPQERREMEEWVLIFFLMNRERLAFAKGFIKEIDQVLADL